MSGDDKRVQVSDKMRAKGSKHQKGKASGPEGGEGVYYALKVQHKTCRENIRAKIKTGTTGENKQMHTHTVHAKYDMTR